MCMLLHDYMYTRVYMYVYMYIHTCMYTRERERQRERWNYHAHRESPGKFGSSNPSRNSISRENRAFDGAAGP